VVLLARFYGYTRMTGQFQDHLYFRHTYEPTYAPPGLSIYPGAPPGDLAIKFQNEVRELHLTSQRVRPRRSARHCLQARKLWNLFGTFCSRLPGQQSSVSKIPIEYEMIRWWAHKDSNLGPAD
jgi:hypothetical protein